MELRTLFRRTLSWFLLAVVAVILVSVVGEWFIHVADDKGWYLNAGAEWDRAVTSIEALFSWVVANLTSAPALIGLGLLGGLVIGLWTDKYLKARESVAPPPTHPPLETAPTPQAAAETPPADVLVQKIARADVLRQFLPKVRQARDVFLTSYRNWLKQSEQKIFGSGLGSGNHRHYKMGYEETRMRFIDASDLIMRESGVVPLKFHDVPPGDVLLHHAPNLDNIMDLSGTAPDADRRLQHRVYYVQCERSKADLEQRIKEMETELGRIESEIQKLSIPEPK